MRKVFIMLCVLFAIACSKGGSGGGGNTHSDVQVSGVVVHSSFSASDIVFFDRNGNRKWDNGEPSANINSDGHYAIAGTAADINTVPLVALLDGQVELIFETPAGQRTISSLTTAIKALMDSNPMLSVDDAHAEVQGELNTNVDIFDNTPASTLALANKVTTVMKAMAKVLADFNISLSDKALMLIMSEIVPQLSNIASDGSVDSNFGGADASAINNDMDAIAANAPKVMNSVDGLSVYQFHNDSSQLHDGTYQFDYVVFTNSNVKSFRNGNAYANALPDKTAQYKGENIPFSVASATEFPLTNLKAGSRHGSKQINFSQGAKLYKVYGIDGRVVPSIDEIIEDGCINASSYLHFCKPISFSNVIDVISAGEDAKLTINSDGTYKIDYVDTTLTGSAREPFNIRPATPRGRYEKIGDNYIFKSLVDGEPEFYIFYDDGGDYGAGYYMAGFRGGAIVVFALFNSVAAKDIQDKW